MKKEKIITFLKGMTKNTKILLIVIGIIIIIIGTFKILSSNKKNRLSTISEVSLQKIIEINELSTIDYTYNATATKYNDNKEAMYYVAYEGVVTAGINFNKIEISVDEKNKKVTITIPEVEIHDVRVNMGTMDYIFTKDKYETETISQEAYKLCKDDLKKRVEKEKLLYETAKENAISSVEALFRPWIETIDEKYQVEVK